MNYNCCICLEVRGVRGIGFGYKCRTCSDGKICWDCCGCSGLGIWEKMSEDVEIMRSAIKCPCCRQENWNVIFDNSMEEIGEFEDRYNGKLCYDWGELGTKKPALNILLKNWKEWAEYQNLKVNWVSLMMAINLRKNSA